MIGRPWLSLTLVSLDTVNFTAVADEYLARKDVKHIYVLEIRYRKIKIFVGVGFTHHLSTIRFRSTIVDNVVA